MSHHPDERRKDPPPPVPPSPAPEATDEGLLDLDDHEGINNQHLEVR